MPLINRILLAGFLLLASIFSATAQPFPNPIVRYVGQHPDFAGIHVDLTVVNWNAYAPIYFAPAPQLPPCGVNPSASRTWVMIYNALNNQQLNSFCSFGAPSNLQHIWFATPVPNKPKAVYVILWDRRANKKVKSNIVKIP